MTDRTKIHLDLDVLNEWYNKLQTETPVDARLPYVGFDQPSEHNEYQFSLWMNKAGHIEMTIKPAITYEKMEHMTYAEINEAQNVNSQ